MISEYPSPLTSALKKPTTGAPDPLAGFPCGGQVHLSLDLSIRAEHQAEICLMHHLGTGMIIIQGGAPPVISWFIIPTN